jgi:hypothetical protein
VSSPGDYRVVLVPDCASARIAWAARIGFVAEARFADSGSGLAPVTDGWFVVNVRDAEWFSSETRGAACWFESEYGEPPIEFPQLGINKAHLSDGPYSERGIARSRCENDGMSSVQNNGTTTGGITGKGFELGRSGNPGGRPKGLAKATRDLVGEDGMALAQLWLQIAMDPMRRDTDRLRASELLADRGWGKPAAFQPIEEDDPLGLADLEASAESSVAGSTASASSRNRKHSTRRRRSRSSLQSLCRVSATPLAQAGSGTKKGPVSGALSWSG